MNAKGLVRFLFILSMVAWTTLSFAAPAAPRDEARDRQIRERYEKVLLQNPFQDRAFTQVYEGYAGVEGIDKWVENLKPATQGPDAAGALLLLGQIYDRQFKSAEALASLEQAGAKGENRPQFKVLLGTLYYKTGQDDKAAALLSSALDALSDLDQRSSVCRLLGNLYLRQGKRDEAIKVWKRIAEQNPKEIFSLLELAEIYEDNRLWDQAMAVYRQIIAQSQDDPYRRCRALRSIGQCLLHAEKHKEAIAVLEEALALVSPGNWLFEDLKLRLVTVYEDMGDLSGLVKYIQAKLEQAPTDLEFRELLAETFGRMAKLDLAEKEHRFILERNPRSTGAYEKLIALHSRMGKTNEVVASFEKLIELFPNDTEYLRRLGEVHLRGGSPDKAKATWQRLTKDKSTPDRIAELAGWYEIYEFPDDAMAAYEQALAKAKNKEWTFRLAGLKYQKGDEAGAIQLWLSVIDPAASKADDYAEVASILESNQKVDEAAKLRKAAVERDPQNLEAHLAYAKILMRQKKFEEAAAEFEGLATQDQNEFLTLQGETGRLDAWRELGLLEEKQKQLEKDLNANPADAKKLGQLTRLYERSGQREKAIALYEGRREKEPDNVEHLRALATLYKAGKQTEQAIASYKTLLDKDKNRARIYQKELLDIYLAVDLKNEAISSGEALVSLAPSDPEVHLTLAQVYQLYRLPEKALNEYRFALRLEPNEPDYHRQYGEALEQEKRYGEAQEAFRKMLDAAKEDSTRLSAVANLARIHLQQDRLPELLNEFQRRIRNTPKKLAAYEELAAISKESGQIFRSVEVLETGLQNVDDKGAALKALIRTAHEAQDFPKVKSYFEQLVALSGKPTANEYEKLGQIYAQLGDVEKAKASWNNILAAAAKDPKAHDRVAKLLQDQGFRDEALVVKAKAVELEPDDYKRRFEYAQWLSQNQQPVQALDQVRLLLEIGDREEKKEKESEKKVQRVSRGQRSTISPYQFMSSGGRFYPGGYYGGSWQGSFKDYRPSVLQFMASLAQQSIGEDAFIEQTRERAKKAASNAELKRDLLTVLQMFNRMDDAVKLAEELLAATPNDPDLLQSTALLYSNQQQLDKAVPLLERIAQTQPKQRLMAATGLVPLYLKNKQEEKALALINDLLKENPTDVTTYMSMSSLLINNGKNEEATRVLNKLKEVDPQQTDSVRYQLASLAKRSGKSDEALALFREGLFAESQRPSYYARSKRVEIYLPVIDPNQARQGLAYGFGGNQLQSLPPTAFGGFDYMKATALNELKLAAKSGGDKGTNVLEEMARIAREWSPAAVPSQRDRSWDMARMLVGQYVIEKEFDKAGAVLAAVRQAGFDEAGWFNAALYVAQQKEDYAGMAKLYDELQQRFPAKARDTTIGRTLALLLAKKYDEAAKAIRNLNEQRVPPAQILNLISQLQRAGEKKLAKQLLEEHLGGVSRNSQALSMLATIYGEENDFNKAIALANEAWERKAQSTQASSTYYGPVYYSSYLPRYGQVDNLLNELHRYYVGAGKSDELISRFKQIVEKQPGSVQAYENLASLYRAGDQREKALEVYQQLAEKRPHLMQIKRNVASLYQEMGQFDKATKVYEDLVKTNPGLYQSFQWELRNAYQRQGKGKELQKMEQSLAATARDPNQLMNLAFRMREDGELDKAIELFRKAAKMSPGQGHMQSQLASALVEKGQLDEALKAYEEWMNSPQTRVQSQSYIDHYTLLQLAGLYKATGKLDDLKKRCETDLQKNSADRTARALQAHIAFLEKRFEDALAGFKAITASGPGDPNVIGQLVQLAGFSGLFKEVLAVAEKANSGNSSWDAQQLSSLYLAIGDKKKAGAELLKWAEQMIQQGNGGFALRQTLDQLSQMDLWDEAEQFAAKHRTDPMQPYEEQEFDRNLAQRYVNDGRFEPIIKSLLAKESLKGRDLALVQRIAEQYQYSNQPTKRRDFLEKIVAADPQNRDLTFSLAQLYNRAEELPKRLAVLKPLAEADPAKLEYRRAVTECLIELGRAEEGLNALAAWAQEKPGEQRWTLLSQMQARAGRAREARESLAQAVSTADRVRKSALQLQLASFETQHGDATAQKEILKTDFPTKKDARTFQSYWRFLDQNGWPAEAHSLFVTNNDSGFFDQYQQSDFVGLCLNYSDYTSAADLNWRFTRFGNRYERDYYFDRVLKVYRDRGKQNWFIHDFAKRVEQDAGANDSLWERVGRSWDQAGAGEKALAIYDRQLQKNPFNRTVAQNKANLLIKLGRADEAIALLRDPKGITSLDLESNAKVALIETLLALGRKTEAGPEIDQLLAWDKRPVTLTRIGNALMDQREFAKALALFEKAAGSLRDWNYEELLMSLAKCRAKLGQAEDLVKLTEQLTRSGNAEWRLQNLQSWLGTEGFPDLAAQVIQFRLKKMPEKLDLHAGLAVTHLDAGRPAEAYAAYEAAAKALPADRIEEVRSSLANLLIDRNLTADALARRESGTSPLLTGALIEVFARTDEKLDRAKLLAEAAVKFQTDAPDLQAKLGGALARMKLPDAAAVWFRRALSSTNELWRVTAAVGLARANGDTTAVPILAELLKTRPHWFTGTDSSPNSLISGPFYYGPGYYGSGPSMASLPMVRPALENDALLAAVAKTGDPALLEKLNQILTAASLHDAERDYYAALMAFHGGQTNDARAKLTALPGALKLNLVQLQTLAKVCAELDMVAERVKTLQRITAGGYPSYPRAQAFGELVQTHAKAGDFKQAAAALAQMQGHWGSSFTETARVALADAVTAENYATFKAAVLEVVRIRPTDDVTSNLLGLCQQIAQRVGQVESGAKLAAAANVLDVERDEASAWDGLIEQWEITGPFRTPGSESTGIRYGGPQQTSLPVKLPEPVLPSSTTWKKTDPRRELGMIHLPALLGLSIPESQGKFAYARTTLSSAEDRRVILCLGADDTVQVWVNGEYVHGTTDPRSGALDQDRIPVQLKKGANQILLKVGNSTDDWCFCLRLADGVDGGLVEKPGERKLSALPKPAAEP